MEFVFFGTPEIATTVLDQLAKFNLIPSLIVTNPDAPVGRKHILTPPPAKVWAEGRDVSVFQPTSLRDRTTLNPLTGTDFDLFVVVAYGKIIPEWLIDLPKHGTINVHPSLLPSLRGASPIRSALLEDRRDTGVTIMQMDSELDHGPIIAQAPASIDDGVWPLRGHTLDTLLATQGGQLLAETIPKWLAGDITPIPQNHDLATFCTKITKDMSELIINPYRLPTGDDAYKILLKIRAFDIWPETFFMYEGKRIKIKDAELSADGSLHITRIVPEGKSEMDFSQYFK